mmetsp:Transcript_35246/g.6343  ORF Transcript_35246/g.6343 Transcript_35246/m.6343 type:complete len:97 (-) Transcript_35246:31-321(-)
MPNDPLFRLMKTCFEVIPGILKQTGKVSNPWPNVDAASGTLLWYYDLKQYEYYTVLFGVARTMGVMANAIWVRSMNISLERPVSVSLRELEELARE